jgi:hypothetical protein
MAFGDGTPISLLSIAGQGIIDSDGHIVHGLRSCSVSQVQGSVTVPGNSSAAITTLSGRTPLVQLETSYPAFNFGFDPTGNDEEGRIIGNPTADPNYSNPVMSSGPISSQFFVNNNNSGSGTGGIDRSTGLFFDPVTAATTTCNYGWI